MLSSHLTAPPISLEYIFYKTMSYGLTKCHSNPTPIYMVGQLPGLLSPFGQYTIWVLSIFALTGFIATKRKAASRCVSSIATEPKRP